MRTAVATSGIESLTRQQHWDGFFQFARNELAVGGPDPQLRYIHWINRDKDWSTKVWRAGVFMAVYNVPTAEVIWTHWPWQRILNEPSELQPWLQEHWRGLRFRKERKTVGLDKTGKKLAQCLIGYASWAAGILPRLDLPKDAPFAAWDEMWRSSYRLPHFGRYAQHKLLELLRRSAGLPIEMPDILPEHGWSPRKGLALLYPEAVKEQDAYDDSPKMVQFHRFLGFGVRDELATKYGLTLDMYRLQTFLCEYRESFERQYPGRSNDSELKYFAAVQPYWDKVAAPLVWQTRMFNARRALLPVCAMGEINGWLTTRDDLGGFYVRKGKMWSDWLYTYSADGEHLRDYVVEESLMPHAQATLHAAI